MAPLCAAGSDGRGATLYEAPGAHSPDASGVLAGLILWMMTDAAKPASIRTMAMTMRAATASPGAARRTSRHVSMASRSPGHRAQ